MGSQWNGAAKYRNTGFEPCKIDLLALVSINQNQISPCQPFQSLFLFLHIGVVI